MIESLIAAGAALLGVGVGGAITWRLETRRDRLADHRGKRVAARLVLMELSVAHGGIEWSAEHGIWWQGPFPVENWRTHAPTLAAHLDSVEWAIVQNAFQAIGAGERTRIQHAAIEGDVHRDMGIALAQMRTALGVLQKYALGDGDIERAAGVVAAVEAAGHVGQPVSWPDEHPDGPQGESPTP